MSENSSAHDLLNHLIDAHQKSYDVKSPAKHEKKIKADHPKYIIVAKGIFTDDHKGHKDSGLCYTFKTSVYRMHEDHATHKNKLSHHGQLVKKDVIVCVPSGRWGASLQAHMSQCIVIPSIQIIRSEHDGKIEHVIQDTTYKVCKIMTYDQIDDKMVFSFTYETKTDDFTDYAKDGTKKGHAAFTIKADEAAEKD